MAYRVGVIGCGFVGKAVAAGFSLHVDSVKMYDKFDNQYYSWNETVLDSDFLFICVPTPTREDGLQDISAINEVVLRIYKTTESHKNIIIKSTVLPGTTRTLAETFPNHSFVFNPEFLSARTARLDFINPSRIILGGTAIPLKEVAELYYHRFGSSAPIYTVSWETAELVKYVANSFFATKVAFCNDIYDIAKRLNVDYEVLKTLWLTDGKVVHSHCDVPGHDGRRGFGGACFPKDLKTFIRWAKDRNLSVDILEAARKWARDDMG